MKNILFLTLAAGFGLTSIPATAAEWPMDGGDVQRTGWQRNEKILTTANVKGLQVLWKVETGNQVRALHSLMPPVIAENIRTAYGLKEVAILTGISDNVWAIDVRTGNVLWKKHYTYPAPPAAAGPQGNVSDPAHLGFLGPGGSSDVPVIGPPEANGRRPVYFVDGGGTLHTLNVGDGEDLRPPFTFATGKGWALNLVGDIMWMPHGKEISAVRLSDPNHKVMTATGGAGGLWGLRGVVVDQSGTAWSTTGDGQYDPANMILGNSLVGFHIVGDELKVKDWYTPTNWEWLLKRDLDPNVTSVLFNYKGRELMASASKECRVWLLDPKNVGGDNHQTPLYRTPLFCNEEVDFQDNGIWGALSTWEENNGTRWVLAPFWGPIHSAFKFPVNNGTVADGGVAAFKVEDKGGKTQLTPAWVSRDMKRAYPPVIANGIVFSFGSGEETKQAFPDIGLNFDSTIRAGKSTHATLFALDALTGKELYSSGDTIKSFSHFSGISVSNGRVYIGTYDGTFYCFGLPGK